MAFIQFSKVSLAFGDRDILKDVSVNLATGTKAALTGANGAGKSTLIKIMAGLVEPVSVWLRRMPALHIFHRVGLYTAAAL